MWFIIFSPWNQRYSQSWHVCNFIFTFVFHVLNTKWLFHPLNFLLPGQCLSRMAGGFLREQDKTGCSRSEELAPPGAPQQGFEAAPLEFISVQGVWHIPQQHKQLELQVFNTTTGQGWRQHESLTDQCINYSGISWKTIQNQSSDLNWFVLFATKNNILRGTALPKILAS